MSRQIRPATPGDVRNVMAAIELLRSARTCLTDAGALRAAEKVRKAIASAEGALRHVHHRQMRTETETLNV